MRLSVTSLTAWTTSASKRSKAMIRIVNKLSSGRFYITIALFLITTTLLLSVCKDPPPPTLVEVGEQLFPNESFSGNGPTCATCHRPTDNFGLTPSFNCFLHRVRGCPVAPETRLVRLDFTKSYFEFSTILGERKHV